MPEPDADTLSPITCAMAPGDAIAALERMSKRGKLAGFRRIDDRTFAAAAHGTPFDRELVGAVEPAGPEGGSRIAWSMRWKRTVPTVFAASLVISVWPGLPLTDSILSTYWGWYSGVTSAGGWLRTWMWYLPLTVPFVPIAWFGALKKSRRSSVEHARETVEKIGAALDAGSG